MMKLKPCPSYPGHHVTEKGEVWRDKVTSKGMPFKRPLVAKAGIIIIEKKQHLVARLVLDAWGKEAYEKLEMRKRPIRERAGVRKRSRGSDRVLTLRELIEEQRFNRHLESLD